MWLVVCWFVADAADAAEIYRCTGAGGEPLFTDVACPNGRPQTAHESNVVDLRLPDVAVARPADPPRQRAVREPRAVARSDDGASRRCVAAQDRLDAVRATMRRGYKASSAGRLEARLREARVRVERDCGR
jgi:hypothetical protein